MRSYVNPMWLEDTVSKMEAGETKEVVTKNAISQKALVYELAKRNIGFRIINMGCGVRKITIDTEICPKCGGSGRV